MTAVYEYIEEIWLNFWSHLREGNLEWSYSQQWRFFFSQSARIFPDTMCTLCLASWCIVTYWRLLFCSIINAPKCKMQHVLRCKCNLIFSRNLRLKGNLLLTMFISRQFEQGIRDLEEKISGCISKIQILS